MPWLLWRAQLCAESRLDPLARSPAGAEGIAQFMPATAAEVWKAMGLGLVDRRMAGPSIAAGSFYMARQRRFWRFPDLDRHKHAVASYNAGAGNILKAWRVCAEETDWTLTRECLPFVTGRHSRETITYVDRIWRFWSIMEAS